MSAPNLISPTTLSGGTPVGGTGTTNTIPRWTGPTTLGDSIISQDNGTSRLLIAGGTAAAAANGTNITIQAQNGGTGNTNGGIIDLVVGLRSGTGTRGYARIDGGLGNDVDLYLGGGTGPTVPYGVGQRAFSGQSHVCVYANAGYGAARASLGMVSGGVYTPALSADPSGNVGIGTASPGYRLDVAGTTGTGFVAARFKSEYATAALVGTDSSSVWFGLGAIGNTNCFQVGTNFLNFRTNGADVARIDSNGNLVVGLAANASTSTNRLQLANNSTAKQGIEFRPGVAIGGGTGNEIVNYDRNLGAYLGTEWSSSFFRLSLSGSYFEASTSGAGVKLPATPGNADTQTLDCYAEGTWTPTLTGFGGTAPTVNAARYTRVGRMVTIQVWLAATGGAAYSGTSTSTYINLPSGMTAAVSAAAIMTDSAIQTLGTGAAYTNGNLYWPTFAATTADTFLTVTYTV